MKYWKDRLHLIACGGCQPKPIGECIECKYYEDIDNKVGACVYKNSLPNAEDNACIHFERRADEHNTERD